MLLNAVTPCLSISYIGAPRRQSPSSSFRLNAQQCACAFLPCRHTAHLWAHFAELANSSSTAADQYPKLLGCVKKKKSCCVEIFSYCSVHCQCDFFIPLKIAFEVSKDKKRTTAYYVYLLAQLFMQILSATIRAPQLKADVFGWWIICLAAGG